MYQPTACACAVRERMLPTLEHRRAGCSLCAIHKPLHTHATPCPHSHAHALIGMVHAWARQEQRGDAPDLRRGWFGRVLVHTGRPAARQHPSLCMCVYPSLVWGFLALSLSHTHIHTHTHTQLHTLALSLSLARSLSLSLSLCVCVCVSLSLFLSPSSPSLSLSAPPPSPSLSLVRARSLYKQLLSPLPSPRLVVGAVHDAVCACTWFTGWVHHAPCTMLLGWMPRGGGWRCGKTTRQVAPLAPATLFVGMRSSCVLGELLPPLWWWRYA